MSNAIVDNNNGGGGGHLALDLVSGQLAQEPCLGNFAVPVQSVVPDTHGILRAVVPLLRLDTLQREQFPISGHCSVSATFHNKAQAIRVDAETALVRIARCTEMYSSKERSMQGRVRENCLGTDPTAIVSH